jgi:RNA polymerase sigma factor (sigma-70 family)
MEAARTPVPVPLRYERTGSGHLLKLGTDESLVRRVRAGDERAFAVIYERHLRAILAFCRHMLGSREEAEDAVQQTFVSAYRDMLRDDKELKLRPWLYRIARNHCISMLRRRRPEVELDGEQASVRGLAEEVSRRSELRALLGDLACLPDDQREALVLAELCDNSHAAVAEILGCEREKVKSLVFQARSSLIKSREARDMSCDDVRLQLSSLKGSALRRGALGRHLAQCDGCRAFRADVRRQRQQLAVLLAVVPTAALKLGAPTALAAAGTKAGVAGIGSATTAGSASAAGTATVAGGGSLAALTAKVATPALVLKGIATASAVTVLAAGGVVGVQRVSETVRGGSAGGQNSEHRGTAGAATQRPPGARGEGAQPSARGSSGRHRGERRRVGAAAPGREHASSGAPGIPLSQSRDEGAGAVGGDSRGKARNELGRRAKRKRVGPLPKRLHTVPVRPAVPVRPERPTAPATPRERPAMKVPPQAPGDEPSGPTVP